MDKKVREKEKNQESKGAQEKSFRLAAENRFGAHNFVHP
jgi:hypothetical protein